MYDKYQVRVTLLQNLLKSSRINDSAAFNYTED